ncbi:unnamed protein product [Linum tenue]|uniref:F-box domain-containing protein n=1 Tax=Linum tenue TaxID=586396 RepID=A0AAV0M6G6_9ROSI|nr:unnamed protein product [Linum tenue]
MTSGLRKAGKRRRWDMKSNSSGSELGKAGKWRREEDEEETNNTGTTSDRLTHLPEPIIYHILSFLDTKAGVQTSILSRAWRSAWKNVPVLDFCSNSFSQYPSYRRYVDKVLSLRYLVNVEKLTYISNESSEEERADSQFGRVVQYALCHDTQHLAIGDRIRFHRYLRFSDLFGSILNCNIRTLELRSIAIDSGFRSFGFQRMTTLKLDWCNFSFEQVEDLDPFSNFPCLQNLSLTNSSNRVPRHLRGGSFKVSGLQLLSLKLELMKFRKFELDAPKLKLLHISEIAGFCSAFSELSLPSLDHADILFYPDSMAKKKHLVSFFKSLHNAICLTLHSKTIQVLSGLDEFLEQPTDFTRLTHLNVSSSSIPYEVVDCFLKGSSTTEPNVQFV